MKAPTLPAELPGPLPAPGSLRCPQALPHPYDVPQPQALPGCGTNSRSRSSQIPAHLLPRGRHVLGSPQAAGEPHPLPLGCGVAPNSSWAAACPVPTQGNPRTRLAASDFPGWESTTPTPWAQSHQVRLVDPKPTLQTAPSPTRTHREREHRGWRGGCETPETTERFAVWLLQASRGTAALGKKTVKSLRGALQLWEPWIWEGLIPD